MINMELKENAGKIFLAIVLIIIVVFHFDWLRSLWSKVPTILVCVAALIVILLLGLYFFQEKLIYITYS